MRWIGLIALVLLAGCGSSIHDDYAQGPVDKGDYKAALMDNQQRLAGEDVRIRPLYTTPFQALGVGFHQVFIDPIVHFYDYLSHDTPAVAARMMLDFNSPDNRRAGTLRLVDFKFARRGPSLALYAHEAADSEDYTVRAAGLRALNRCRAKGFTALFLHNLEDDQPLVRLEAADALSNIPDPDAVHALIDHMQNDISHDVEIACADALRCYATREVANALVDMLDDKDFSVAWQARQSLALLTGQDFRYDQKAWLGYIASRSWAQ